MDNKNYKIIETAELKKIANAIRIKRGETDLMPLEDMVYKILGMEASGVIASFHDEEGNVILFNTVLTSDDGNGNVTMF